MDRRDFLRASALVSGAAMIGGSQAVAGQFTGKIKKAVKGHMVIGDMPMDDKFRLVRDLGFDGIEVRAKLESKDKQLVRSYAEAREKTELPIHGLIHSNNPDLIGAIDQAKMLGANSILHVVRYDQSIPYMQNYKETQDIIRKAIDHAEKHGVMLLLENVWASFLIEPLGMARYIDELESPMVGSYFDVGNVVRWGWPQHWIEVLGKRVKKLDIKEYDLKMAMNEGMRKGFSPPLGGGSIQWEKVRSELAAIEYEGWATAEVKGGDETRLKEIAEQMDKVLDLI
ncbi:MAG: TIM barrel protein [Rubripirellula sp.]